MSADSAEDLAGVRTLPGLIERLAAHPAVLGLIRYGGRALDDDCAGGDLDLLVPIDQRPAEIESIHFHLSNVPIDLNLRTWADLERDPPLTPIDDVFFTGEILHDRQRDLAQRLHILANRKAEALPAPSEQAVAFMRFGHRHALNKLRGRREADPILCRLLLESNLYWLLENYFRVRRLRFPGEKAALQHLHEHEPELWRDVQRFYAEDDLDERVRIAEELGQLVLAPIGGLWRQNEILTFATDADAVDVQSTGRALLKALLTCS